MHDHRAEDLERGSELVARLPEIMPEMAAAQGLRPIYDDIEATLRVPVMNFIFRVLANYPTYLAFAWSRVGRYLRLLALERAADDLRARSLLEPVPDASDVDWIELGDLGQIRPFTDTIHYVLPKLLLVATAFDTGLARTPRALNGKETLPLSQVRGGPLAEVPFGIAEGTVSLPMVHPKEATGELRAILDEVKRRHHHPGVASYYRALANWPRFLRAAWEHIRPLIGSNAYNQRKRELIDGALGAIQGFSLPEVSEAKALGITDQQIEELRAILAVFRFRLIPDLLLEVTLIKAMLDGPEAARSSHLNAAK
jgi:hypothetical protein